MSNNELVLDLDKSRKPTLMESTLDLLFRSNLREKHEIRIDKILLRAPIVLTYVRIVYVGLFL